MYTIILDWGFDIDPIVLGTVPFLPIASELENELEEMADIEGYEVIAVDHNQVQDFMLVDTWEPC